MKHFAQMIRTGCDPRIVLPLIFVWVLVFTAPAVFNHALWGDEFRTWRDGIEKPLSAVLTWQHNPDHAPLGHLLARMGAALFGVEHPWALRLGNYLCGLLCIPALWWMGRSLSSNAAGLLAAGMFAVDPNCLFQITQARMYGALLLAGICAFTLAGSIVNKPDKPWRRVVLLGVALAAGIWAHSTIYAVLLSIFLLAIGLLWAHRRVGISLLAALLIAGALGAQGVAKIVSRHDADKIETPDDSGDQLSEAIEKLGGNDSITVVLAVSTVGGAVVLFRKGHRSLAMLVLMTVVIALANLSIASRYRPISQVRYLTILQPPMWLAMATCTVALCQWRFAGSRIFTWVSSVGPIVLLVGISAYEFSRALLVLEPHPLAMPFAQAAKEIRSKIASGERFMVVPRLPYGFYTRYYGLKLDAPMDDALSERSSVRRSRQAMRDAKLDEKQIWILGVIQPSFSPPHVNDNPIDFANRIAKARGIESGLPQIDFAGEAKRLTLIRIDDSSVTVEK